MKRTNPHAPAYPGTWEEEGVYGTQRVFHEPGSTILEEFCKAAMQGIISNPYENMPSNPKAVAEAAFNTAMAMIDRLNDYYRQEDKRLREEREKERRSYPLSFYIISSDDNRDIGCLYSIHFDEIEGYIKASYMNSVHRTEIGKDILPTEVQLDENKMRGTLFLSNGSFINIHLNYFD